jgi:hypothetical protein
MLRPDAAVPIERPLTVEQVLDELSQRGTRSGLAGQRVARATRKKKRSWPEERQRIVRRRCAR